MIKKRYILIINAVSLFIVWEYLASILSNAGIALDNLLPVYEVYGSDFMVKIIFVLLILIGILIAMNIICFFCKR